MLEKQQTKKQFERMKEFSLIKIKIGQQKHFILEKFYCISNSKLQLEGIWA
jgi:hypothetical protein